MLHPWSASTKTGRAALLWPTQLLPTQAPAPALSPCLLPCSSSLNLAWSVWLILRVMWSLCGLPCAPATQGLG